MTSAGNSTDSPNATAKLAAAIAAGNRRALARGITLIENSLPAKRRQANQLIAQLLPHSGSAIRIGISGVPGAGKSTFIEALGLHLTGLGQRVAVLAIDPSSQISGGSILGDKVRMERLARKPAAFIRPSPTAGTLGGVTRRTRESMLLCEAAGFDIILVETVGVGQSEVAVCGMTDCFLLLLLPNADDEIQGFKKGIVEMADVLLVNKADGEFLPAARKTRRHFRNALHFLRPKNPPWQPKIELISALHGEGIDTAWQAIQAQRQFLEEGGRLAQLRRQQTHAWFHETVKDQLLERLYSDKRLFSTMQTALTQIDENRISAHQAAEDVLNQFLALPHDKNLS